MQSIERLENMGYVIKEENNKIVFNYESGIIEDIREVERAIKELKNNENKVIDFLKVRDIKINHNAALKHNYLPYAYGECYGKQITNNSFLFIQRIEDCKIWTVYRITYNDFLQISSDKTIIETNNFIAALNRSEKYINNYMKFIKG